jgi:hypothetical protein
MAINPNGANDAVRPKLGSVAAILAQSQIVSDAFGRTAGSVLVMGGLCVHLSVSVMTIFFVGKGAGVALAPLFKFRF